MSSQQNIDVTSVTTVSLKTDLLIGIDNFGTFYYITNNTFYKNDQNKHATYSNVQLGPIASANAFNPLKINLFYKNFNTVILLDNRLSEVYRLHFNTIQPYKNITHVSTGYDTTIWIFNQDVQQLELYDYKTNTTRATTLPVQSNVLDLKSNYNYCWLLTEKFLYTYNYFGSVISKIKNDNFSAIAEDNGNLIIKQNNHLLFKAKDTEELIPIKIPQLLINQFLVTNETLYIYDSEMLHQFQLKIK